MFKRKMLFLTLPLFLYGGLLDFQVLDKAKTSYAEEKYDESAKLYNTLEAKGDAVHYNLGNAYYKEKAYDKAIAEFKQVNNPELKAKALYNLGNAYAQSKKVDEAIATYEEALKLNEDDDTKFNLELLKKQKQEQEKKRDQKKKNDQNKDQKDQQKKDQQKKDDQKKSKDQKKGDDQKEQKDQQKSKDKKSEEKKKKEAQEKERKAQEKKDKEKKDKEENMNPKEAKAQEQPISDMQERKYEKMLDRRGIKTLMVPLKTEGGRDEETTAW